MVRDARIRRRNALVIPGWLLIAYSVAAIIYAEGIRTGSDFCDEASRVLINGLCYSVWKLVAPLLLIGIGLAIGGGVGLRGHPQRLEQRLQHGSPSYVILAVLLSLVFVPLTLLLIQFYRQGQNDIIYQVELLGVPYKHVFLLAMAALVAALMLAPYLFSWIAQERRRRDFLAAVGADEPAEPDIETPVEVEERQPEPVADVAEEWPGEREEPLAEPEATRQEGGRKKGYRVPATPVLDLEGVGPAYEARLKAQGIENMDQLYQADAKALAESTEISPALIETWQSMCELIAVKGIGPQYAEALVRAGLTGIDELRRRSATAIAKQVTAYLASLDNHVLGQAVTETRVTSWQDAAKGMRKT
ncbi:MAG: DUF4332 domain-containing protein [Thermoplasmatota archaeon]